jgi:hypothetical protein
MKQIPYRGTILAEKISRYHHKNFNRKIYKSAIAHTDKTLCDILAKIGCKFME